MTKDKARKRVAREQQKKTGQPYTLAARETGFGMDPETGRVSARRYAEGLVREFVKAGWLPSSQAGVDTTYGPWTFYVGPAAQVDVYRVDRDGYDLAEGDPDDPVLFDQAQGLRVSCATPAESFEGDDGALERLFDTDEMPPQAVVAGIRKALLDSRQLGLKSRLIRARCFICEMPLPEQHLYWMGTREPYCPGCFFRAEDGAPTVGGFVGFYDELLHASSSYPVQWTALAALTAVLMGHSRRSAEDIIKESNGFPIVMNYWEHPEDLWVWLPQAPETPASLHKFGAGATLGAIVSALDDVHPDLRARYASAVAEASGVTSDSEPDEFAQTANAVQAYWLAVVSFAVAFLMTSTTEGLLPDDEWAAMLLDTEAFYLFLDQLRLADDPGDLLTIIGSAHRLVEMIAPGFKVVPGWGS